MAIIVVTVMMKMVFDIMTIAVLLKRAKVDPSYCHMDVISMNLMLIFI